MSQNLSISIVPGLFMPELHYSQGDIGRTFTISLGDYTIPSGATVQVVATKPSGFGFTTACTVSDNVITCTTTEDMTDEWGRFPAEVKITSGSTVLGTANFMMVGEKNPHPDGTTDGQQESIVPELTLLVERVETAASNILDMTVTAETLSAGSSATYSYDEDSNTATFGIPQGEAGSGAAGVVASAYDASATYEVGDYVMHNSLLYRCTTAITTAESWTSGHWTQVVMGDEVSVLGVYTKEPINLIDTDQLYSGRYLWNGTLQSNSSYKTTDYIPVEKGDVLRFFTSTIRSSYDNVRVVEGTSAERLMIFDADKNVLTVGGQYPFGTITVDNVTVPNAYLVSTDDAAYIRVSYPASNTYPTLAHWKSNLTDYVPYFKPEKDSKKVVCDVKPIVDIWGDSRVEMSAGTTIGEYLNGLLGSDYIVSSHGISGQASGSVAMRFGANEVYVQLSGNTIPASGSVEITGIKCSVSSKVGYNMETADRGSHCYINGIGGVLEYHRSGTSTFTRDSDGIATYVQPYTRAIPDKYFDGSHIQIMWAGKNDFSYSFPNIMDGILCAYRAMADMIPHDKFIVLGETGSINSSYYPGGTDRNYITDINNWLAYRYPTNFIDIEAELISQGLTLEGITATEADNTNISNGVIPDSLMEDTVHLNQYGREAVAKIIYQYMTNWGWLS